MKKTFIPKGICASKIDVEIENGVIKSVQFTGGCDGNLTGITRLVQGMDAQKATELLSGIRCGRKSTSCPDQLAKALQEAVD
ncbi:TIGR03905 family TSCPD domain-containing protein [Oscillospiraceae bacterium CM]|nr:TIGR03905 family TSCPD domain-containing protein [Oscillospiraceae bacterium CM]